MIRRCVAGVLVPLLAVVVLMPAGAAAAPPSAPQESPEVVSARQHFKAGEKAFNAGDYARALREFETGYALVPRAGFLLNMAHTERRLGHPARARELYQRYLDTDPQSAQRAGVPGLIAELDRTPGASARGEVAPSTPPAGLGGPPPGAVTNPRPAEPAAPETAPESAASASVTEEPPPPEARAAAPLPAAPPPAEEPPAVVSTAPSREVSDGQSAHRPVYKQWWFWAVVGVVAVGATTTAILATRPATPAFQDDGSLGRIGP
jgi:tetratricopeptide (TPR) repeat protein